MFLLSSLIFLAAAVSGQESNADWGATPESLMQEAMRSQATGDFESVWRALVAFYGHPGSNEADIRTYVDCFMLPGCPSIGFLGAFLGKSRAEAGDLSRFCPHWNRQRARIHAGDTAGLAVAETETLDMLHSRSLRGTCAKWHSRQLKLLHAEPPLRPEPVHQVLPFELMDEPYSIRGLPRTELAVDEHIVTAILDTGSDITGATSNDADLLEYLSGAELLDTRPSMTGRGTRRYEVLRGPSIRLGRTTFQDVLLDRPVGPAHLEAGYILGMNILLRYPKVCFDWQDSRLFLGDLGPCAGGLSPDHAYLVDNFLLYLEVSLPDGSVMPALLDTGSTVTYCSKAFVEANNGRQHFVFRSHPELAGECEVSDDVYFKSVVIRRKQIQVGMDTFRQYAAFGWELNPLRVYFVAKAD